MTKCCKKLCYYKGYDSTTDRMEVSCLDKNCPCHQPTTTPPTPSGESELKEYFEANYLDGDKIQDGQMIASSECFEAIKDCLSSRLTEIEGKIESEMNRDGVELMEEVLDVDSYLEGLTFALAIIKEARENN